MMWKSKRLKKGKQTMKRTKDGTNDVFQPFLNSADFKVAKYTNQQTDNHFNIALFSTLVDERIVQSDILPYLLEKNFKSLTDLHSIVPIENIEITNDLTQLEEKLLTGNLVIQSVTEQESIAFISAPKEVARDVTMPEVEFSVIGSKEAFVESLDKNINLIRKRLPVKELKIEELLVGRLSKSRVAVFYIDGIADPANVQTVRQRVGTIDFDQISDSSFISELIADNTNSIFPQLLDTERPDRVAAELTEGKIIIMVNGSPHALIGPTILLEYLDSFEDYFTNWIVASLFRLIRLFSVIFSVSFTSLYVAIVTYHYQLIPRDLLNTLVTSRREIPFPPILEALILELTIELLREAGARLPTKVGQTIGIVGGIVIGTASVEAGLTSNVLLIIVALSAIASFTTPVYQMGNTIRFLRFPFILFAQLWGLIGVAFCTSLLLTHLLRLTSLGRPYLEPIYPPRISDYKDTFIRLPFSYQAKLPKFTNTQTKFRFNPFKAKVRKDIDE